ncbi:MAG: hydrogenase nickel incorporation protein HypB [Pseudomonadota bacterium]|jgi:hydrogenase nickel incorporation protein HypB
MCDTCGCSITPGNRATAAATQAVPVLEGLLAENDRLAAHNRAHFEHHGVLAVNLMSSPGSGKTLLLEATVEALRGELACAVLVGDLATDNDARRIAAHGVPAVQIGTGQACHLDAHMVHDALHGMDLSGIDILFIENVGNLVCPASFDLGQHHNVVLLSVTEGDDKPAKYPVMFRAADLVLISKADLLPFMEDFDPARAEGYLRDLASQAPVLTLSARSGEGMAAWLEGLRAQHAALRRPRPAAARPHFGVLRA